MMHLLFYKRSHAPVKAMKAANETIVTATISTSSIELLLTWQYSRGNGRPLPHIPARWRRCCDWPPAPPIAAAPPSATVWAGSAQEVPAGPVRQINIQDDQIACEAAQNIQRLLHAGGAAYLVPAHLQIGDQQAAQDLIVFHQ